MNEIPQNIFDHLIGRYVELPDGGQGKIYAVSVSGMFKRVEWCVQYWYGGDQRTVWVEPSEVTLIEK